MYSQIVNPATERYVNINSSLGQQIINNYLNILSGGRKTKAIRKQRARQHVRKNSREQVKKYLIEYFTTPSEIFYKFISLELMKQNINIDSIINFDINDIDKIIHQEIKNNPQINWILYDNKYLNLFLYLCIKEKKIVKIFEDWMENYSNCGGLKNIMVRASDFLLENIPDSDAILNKKFYECTRNIVNRRY